MKKVLKNMLICTAFCSLILTIVLSVYFGIYVYKINKIFEEEGVNLETYIVNTDNESEGLTMSEQYVRVILTIQRYRLVELILFGSIFIGSIIGIVISIDENSYKKVLFTYILMFPVVVILLELYERVRDEHWIDFTNLIDRLPKVFGIYTLVFIAIIFSKRMKNKIKLNYINKNLK